jgi:hypothetical protein
MKKYITTVSFAKIAVLVFVLFTTLVNAQTDLPVAPEDEPAAAPIDGYVWVLAAIGLIYVFLRIQAFAKQENAESI